MLPYTEDHIITRFARVSGSSSSIHGFGTFLLAPSLPVKLLWACLPTMLPLTPTAMCILCCTLSGGIPGMREKAYEGILGRR